jgi:hypothetical protein
MSADPSRSGASASRVDHTVVAGQTSAMRALLVTTATICGAIGIGVGIVDATTSTPSSADVAVATAVANTLQAGSARVTIVLGVGEASGGTIAVGSGGGVVDFSTGASRLAFELEGTAARSVALVEEIDVGGKLYLHVPKLTARVPRVGWIEVAVPRSMAPTTSGGGGVSPSTVLLRELEEPGNSAVAMGTATVDGESLQKYVIEVHAKAPNIGAGNDLIPSSVRREILGVLANHPPVGLTVWVGPSARIVRVSTGTAVSLRGVSAASVRFSVDLGDFGAPGAITAPTSGVIGLGQVLNLARVFAKL